MILDATHGVYKFPRKEFQKKYQKTFDSGIYWVYTTHMRRGAIRKSHSRLINVWFPESIIPVIDQAVVIEDSDRSKFIRNAVREKLETHGLRGPKPEHAPS